jgi:hypothetical protein
VKALFFGGGHKTRYYSCISYMQSADKLLVDSAAGTLAVCCKISAATTASIDYEVACLITRYQVALCLDEYRVA